ncbi:RHS domain-containing protein [Apibacter raozihei]|uniref:RHS repeat domain-containing protein n=1 Tax=Apibacter raozihei TaxID=2500547 RepID=UPI002938DEAE|nr:RHS repeat-associated core domain-containing protein [Apibacter raozihei]
MFDEDSFVPVAKLRGNKKYSILADHLGTPSQMYKENGELFWEASLDSFGRLKLNKGESGSCPFRYQGQYEDVETGLYYNRFRYYSPEEGLYISQDPIGLQGGIEFYSYVHDPNGWIDPLGLTQKTYGEKRDVDKIAEKYGGKKIDENRYEFDGPDAKKRARQAASEISGDLGSDPNTIRRKDYVDANNTYKNNNSNRVIGKHSSTLNSNEQPVSGYHDHEIGHSRFNAPKHYNAWSESTGTNYTDNVHLYY